MTICPHCHTVYASQPTIAWEDIKGYYHVKRAIEVALAGRHALTVYGTARCEHLVSLLHHAKAQGLHVYLVQPCPCGNLGDPRFDCPCELDDIEQYRSTLEWRATLQADIYVEAGYLSEHQAREKRKGEPLAATLGRVASALTRQPVEMVGEDAEDLLRIAIRQMPEIAWVSRRIERVAGAVARLAGHAGIQAGDMAEAIQYRPRFMNTIFAPPQEL